MPKTVEKVPEGIRPYAFHKLGLRESTGGQYLGDCPFCGGSDKLFVNQETGQYRCVVCPPAPGKDKHGGNVYTFLRELHTLTSKFKGVSKLRQKWRAQINSQGNTYHLGLYLTEIEAALVYDRESYQRFGEYTKLNFPERKPIYRTEVSNFSFE